MKLLVKRKCSSTSIFTSINYYYKYYFQNPPFIKIRYNRIYSFELIWSLYQFRQLVAFWFWVTKVANESFSNNIWFMDSGFLSEINLFINFIEIFRSLSKKKLPQKPKRFFKLFGLEFLLVGGHTNYVCWYIPCLIGK